MKKVEVLCVDDDPQVLEGLKMHLKQRYVVHCATGGPQGLEVVAANKDIAVIMSDMRMPGMDGAKFLNAVRSAAPNAVRMLLTGYADVQSAIAAVNEGQIFRFISKPCAPDQLFGAFAAAVTQHRLIVAEKVLLQKTLLGCVESLAKVLSVSKPAAFGRAIRLKSKVRSVVQQLQWEDQWQIEAAAVLSQLGAVTLSEETLLKLNDGETIEAGDRHEIAASVDTSIKMLENIPRLEPVLEILRYLATAIRGDRSPSSDGASPGAKLLHLVSEWDVLEAHGYGQDEAFQVMSASKQYDAALLTSLESLRPAEGAKNATMSVAPAELEPGMILSEDLVRKNGVMILPRGFEIDAGLLAHVHNFAHDLKDAKVSVFTRT